MTKVRGFPNRDRAEAGRAAPPPVLSNLVITRKTVVKNVVAKKPVEKTIVVRQMKQPTPRRGRRDRRPPEPEPKSSEDEEEMTEPEGELSEGEEEDPGSPEDDDTESEVETAEEVEVEEDVEEVEEKEENEEEEEENEEEEEENEEEEEENEEGDDDEEDEEGDDEEEDEEGDDEEEDEEEEDEEEEEEEDEEEDEEKEEEDDEDEDPAVGQSTSSSRPKRTRVPNKLFDPANCEAKRPSDKPKENVAAVLQFHKGEFLAVRNEKGGFYVCRPMHNVTSRTSVVKVQWLLRIPGSRVYSFDDYDKTFKESILTNVNMTKVSATARQLPESEQKRVEGILRKSLLPREEGKVPKTDQVVVNELGVDVSGATSTSQLRKAVQETSEAARQANKKSKPTPKQRAKSKEEVPKKLPKKTGTPRTSTKKKTNSSENKKIEKPHEKMAKPAAPSKTLQVVSLGKKGNLTKPPGAVQNQRLARNLVKKAKMPKTPMPRAKLPATKKKVVSVKKGLAKKELPKKGSKKGGAPLQLPEHPNEGQPLRKRGRPSKLMDGQENAQAMEVELSVQRKPKGRPPKNKRSSEVAPQVMEQEERAEPPQKNRNPAQNTPRSMRSEARRAVSESAAELSEETDVDEVMGDDEMVPEPAHTNRQSSAKKMLPSKQASKARKKKNKAPTAQQSRASTSFVEEPPESTDDFSTVEQAYDEDEVTLEPVPHNSKSSAKKRQPSKQAPRRAAKKDEARRVSESAAELSEDVDEDEVMGDDEVVPAPAHTSRQSSAKKTVPSKQASKAPKKKNKAPAAQLATTSTRYVEEYGRSPESTDGNSTVEQAYDEDEVTSEPVPHNSKSSAKKRQLPKQVPRSAAAKKSKGRRVSESAAELSEDVDDDEAMEDGEVVPTPAHTSRQSSAKKSVPSKQASKAPKKKNKAPAAQQSRASTSFVEEPPESTDDVSTVEQAYDEDEVTSEPVPHNSKSSAKKKQPPKQVPRSAAAKKSKARRVSESAAELSEDVNDDEAMEEDEGVPEPAPASRHSSAKKKLSSKQASKAPVTKNKAPAARRGMVSTQSIEEPMEGADGDSIVEQVSDEDEGTPEPVPQNRKSYAKKKQPSKQASTGAVGAKKKAAQPRPTNSASEPEDVGDESAEEPVVEERGVAAQPLSRSGRVMTKAELKQSYSAAPVKNKKAPALQQAMPSTVPPADPWEYSEEDQVPLAPLRSSRKTPTPKDPSNQASTSAAAYKKPPPKRATAAIEPVEEPVDDTDDGMVEEPKRERKTKMLAKRVLAAKKELPTGKRPRPSTSTEEESVEESEEEIATPQTVVAPKQKVKPRSRSTAAMKKEGPAMKRARSQPRTEDIAPVADAPEVLRKLKGAAATGGRGESSTRAEEVAVEAPIEAVPREEVTKRQSRPSKKKVEADETENALKEAKKKATRRTAAKQDIPPQLTQAASTSAVVAKPSTKRRAPEREDDSSQLEPAPKRGRPRSASRARSDLQAAAVDDVEDEEPVQDETPMRHEDGAVQQQEGSSKGSSKVLPRSKTGRFLSTKGKGKKTGALAGSAEPNKKPEPKAVSAKKGKNQQQAAPPAETVDAVNEPRAEDPKRKRERPSLRNEESGEVEISKKKKKSLPGSGKKPTSERGKRENGDPDQAGSSVEQGPADGEETQDEFVETAFVEEVPENPADLGLEPPTEDVSADYEQEEEMEEEDQEHVDEGTFPESSEATGEPTGLVSSEASWSVLEPEPLSAEHLAAEERMVDVEEEKAEDTKKDEAPQKPEVEEEQDERSSVEDPAEVTDQSEAGLPPAVPPSRLEETPDQPQVKKASSDNEGVVEIVEDEVPIVELQSTEVVRDEMETLVVDEGPSELNDAVGAEPTAVLDVSVSTENGPCDTEMDVGHQAGGSEEHRAAVEAVDGEKVGEMVEADKFPIEAPEKLQAQHESGDVREDLDVAEKEPQPSALVEEQLEKVAPEETQLKAASIVSLVVQEHDSPVVSKTEKEIRAVADAQEDLQAVVKQLAKVVPEETQLKAAPIVNLVFQEDGSSVVSKIQEEMNAASDVQEESQAVVKPATLEDLETKENEKPVENRADVETEETKAEVEPPVAAVQRAGSESKEEVNLNGAADEIEEEPVEDQHQVECESPEELQAEPPPVAAIVEKTPESASVNEKEDLTAVGVNGAVEEPEHEAPAMIVDQSEDTAQPKLDAEPEVQLVLDQEKEIPAVEIAEEPLQAGPEESTSSGSEEGHDTNGGSDEEKNRQKKPRRGKCANSEESQPYFKPSEPDDDGETGNRQPSSTNGNNSVQISGQTGGEKAESNGATHNQQSEKKEKSANGPQENILAAHGEVGLGNESSPVVAVNIKQSVVFVDSLALAVLENDLGPVAVHEVGVDVGEQPKSTVGVVTFDFGEDFGPNAESSMTVEVMKNLADEAVAPNLGESPKAEVDPSKGEKIVEQRHVQLLVEVGEDRRSEGEPDVSSGLNETEPAVLKEADQKTEPVLPFVVSLPQFEAESSHKEEPQQLQSELADEADNVACTGNQEDPENIQVQQEEDGPELEPVVDRPNEDVEEEQPIATGTLEEQDQPETDVVEEFQAEMVPDVAEDAQEPGGKMEVSVEEEEKITLEAFGKKQSDVEPFVVDNIPEQPITPTVQDNPVEPPANKEHQGQLMYSPISDTAFDNVYDGSPLGVEPGVKEDGPGPSALTIEEEEEKTLAVFGKKLDEVEPLVMSLGHDATEVQIGPPRGDTQDEQLALSFEEEQQQTLEGSSVTEIVGPVVDEVKLLNAVENVAKPDIAMNEDLELLPDKIQEHGIFEPALCSGNAQLDEAALSLEEEEKRVLEAFGGSAVEPFAYDVTLEQAAELDVVEEVVYEFPPSDKDELEQLVSFMFAQEPEEPMADDSNAQDVLDDAPDMGEFFGTFGGQEKNTLLTEDYQVFEFEGLFGESDVQMNNACEQLPMGSPEEHVEVAEKNEEPVPEAEVGRPQDDVGSNAGEEQQLMLHPCVLIDDVPDGEGFRTDASYSLENHVENKHGYVGIPYQAAGDVAENPTGLDVGQQMVDDTVDLLGSPLPLDFEDGIDSQIGANLGDKVFTSRGSYAVPAVSEAHAAEVARLTSQPPSHGTIMEEGVGCPFYLTGDPSDTSGPLAEMFAALQSDDLRQGSGLRLGELSSAQIVEDSVHVNPGGAALEEESRNVEQQPGTLQRDEIHFDARDVIGLDVTDGGGASGNAPEAQLEGNEAQETGLGFAGLGFADNSWPLSVKELKIFKDASEKQRTGYSPRVIATIMNNLAAGRGGTLPDMVAYLMATWETVKDRIYAGCLLPIELEEGLHGGGGAMDVMRAYGLVGDGRMIEEGQSESLNGCRDGRMNEGEAGVMVEEGRGVDDGEENKENQVNVGKQLEAATNKFDATGQAHEQPMPVAPNDASAAMLTA